MIFISAPPVRVPFTDQDGLPVEWTQWIAKLEELFNLIQRTGTTAQRPALAPFVGFMYFDTTVNRPIWAKTITTSTVWVYSDGSAA